MCRKFDFGCSYDLADGWGDEIRRGVSYEDFIRKLRKWRMMNLIMRLDG